jgi:OOP family OmpA-OmpF porin
MAGANNIEPHDEMALVGLGGVDDFIPQRAAGGAFKLEAGVGLISRPLFENGIRLRLDARAPVLPPTTTVHEVVREVIKEVPRQWVDTDRDGVDDEHDKCPNSPAGSKVGSIGCVIPNQTIELLGSPRPAAEVHMDVARESSASPAEVSASNSSGV